MFIRSCCGQAHDGPVCPDGLVMCCLCFRRFEIKNLHELTDGTYEDVCKICAAEEQLRILQNGGKKIV